MYTPSGAMDAQIAQPDIVSTVAAKLAARGQASTHHTHHKHAPTRPTHTQALHANATNRQEDDYS